MKITTLILFLTSITAFTLAIDFYSRILALIFLGVTCIAGGVMSLGLEK